MMLDITPEECGTCIETPGTVDVETGFADCPSCHGSGRVYPAELVERIEGALVTAFGRWFVESEARHLAVAVLDALNGEDA